jgi:hypothetical protein
MGLTESADTALRVAGDRGLGPTTCLGPTSSSVAKMGCRTYDNPGEGNFYSLDVFVTCGNSGAEATGNGGPEPDAKLSGSGTSSGRTGSAAHEMARVREGPTGL